MDPMAGGADDATRERKVALRRTMRRIRSSIPERDRAARGEAIAAAALALPETAAAATVFAFLSFGDEVPTRGLVAGLLAAGKRVVLPAVTDGVLEAAAWREGDPLTQSFYGAAEPADRTAVDPAEIDLVLAPGLAFDRRGRRLGYGGAYYDRFLPRLRPGATVAALAFHEQVVDEVPAAGHDRVVDVVLTDRETIRVDRGERRPASL